MLSPTTNQLWSDLERDYSLMTCAKLFMKFPILHVDGEIWKTREGREKLRYCLPNKWK